MMGKKSGRTKRGMVAPSQPRHSWTTRGKPRICDCYDVLETVAWTWRLLGIFPFTMATARGTKNYRINYLYAVYSVFIFVACFANLIYSITHWMDYLRSEDVARAYACIVARTMACILCMIISSVIRIYRNKELLEVIGAMAAQEVLLEKMGCRLNYTGKAKMFRIYLWTSVVIAVLLTTYDYYCSVQGGESFKLQWLVWIIPLVAQILDLTIFVLLVGLLGSKFRALNEKIKTIIIRVNALSPKVVITSDVCAENLRLVAKAHYNICAVGKRVNTFFDWNVIINVITAFIILLSTLHTTFLEVQRVTQTNYIRIGSYIHWEIFHSAPIIVIVVMCNWTSHQSMYAGKLIHEIRVEKTDSKLYEALKSFSLQLHHQKLEFTAGGFFLLNSTLLRTMVANITTYLVILIQFSTRETWDANTL